MDYAADVLAGRIVVCHWITQACKRAVADREASGSEDCPYAFDPAKAERVCRFIELFPHTKGKWALKREPFVLSPWQCFFVCELFGWVRKSDGLRRFRKGVLFVPRKNGKSDLAARIGLYMLTGDNEYGAEVYSGATTEKQAWEVFRPALLMAKSSPDFISHYGVSTFKQSISVAGTASRFEPVIGKPGDGASPTSAIVDEYHEHDTDDLVQTMVTGMGAREQPLLLIITTSGVNVSGPAYAMWLEIQQVMDGVVENDELFGLIYTIDQNDDWTDPALLEKANPNFGVSVGSEFLLARHRDAMTKARDQGPYQTKHLNRWVGARAAYFDMPKWIAGKRDISLRDFGQSGVKIGLDLASKVDIAALTMLFEEGGEYCTFSKFYLPEATVRLGHNQHYQAWELEGRLTVTDGEMIDFARIKEDILQLARDFVIEEVAFDPHQATMLVTELMKEGISCVEVRPLVLNFSEPMKQVDALIRAGKLSHDGCPVMTWMMGNVTAKADAKDNVYPRKEKDENKIDGPVALLMAMARAMVPKAESPPSVYASRGLRFL